MNITREYFLVENILNGKKIFLNLTYVCSLCINEVTINLLINLLHVTKLRCYVLWNRIARFTINKKKHTEKQQRNNDKKFD